MRTRLTVNKSSTPAGSLACAWLMADWSREAQPAACDNPCIFPKPNGWQALSQTASCVTGDTILPDAKVPFRMTSKGNPALLNGNLLHSSKPVNYLVIHASATGTPYVSGQSDMQPMTNDDPALRHLKDLPLNVQDVIYRQMCALDTHVARVGHPVKAR